MRARSLIPALAQDDDLVGVAHGRSAVRDQNGGAPVHDAPQACGMRSSVCVSTLDRDRRGSICVGRG